MLHHCLLKWLRIDATGDKRLHACDGDATKKTIKNSNLKQPLVQNTGSIKYLLWLSKCID